MNEKSDKILVLIDSNAIIHRAYHALPKNMSTSKGELTNAVYGYATTLIKVLEDLHPTHIAASFDISKATFRLAEYAAYKGTRVKADQELYDQIPKARELLEALNIPVYEKEGFEADDCIGTIVELCSVRNKQQVTSNECKDIHIYIVTGDKDAFQLVNGNVEVYDLKRGISDAQIINSIVIKSKYNLDPHDFIDLKALAGDPSDNIPGVPGIGPKTATDLIQKFDTLEKLYEAIEAVIPDLIGNPENKEMDPRVKPEDDKLEEASKKLGIKPRIIGLLIENKDQAFLSQRLATIRRDVPLDFNLEDCVWGDYDKGKLKDFFERMQFHSLLKRFGAERGEEPKTEEAKEQKEKDEQLKLL